MVDYSVLSFFVVFLLVFFLFSFLFLFLFLLLFGMARLSDTAELSAGHSVARIAYCERTSGT